MQWKKKKFIKDSVLEIWYEITMEIDKIHGTFSLKKLRNAMKREEIPIGFNF